MAWCLFKHRENFTFYLVTVRPRNVVADYTISNTNMAAVRICKVGTTLVPLNSKVMEVLCAIYKYLKKKNILSLIRTDF
jgi:hypothetical protein